MTVDKAAVRRARKGVKEWSSDQAQRGGGRTEGKVGYRLRLHLLSMEEGVPTLFKCPYVESTRTRRKRHCRREPEMAHGREPMGELSNKPERVRSRRRTRLTLTHRSPCLTLLARCECQGSMERGKVKVHPAKAIEQFERGRLRATNHLVCFRNI